MGEILKLQNQVHEMAKQKGWWEKNRNPLELIALVHAELSEAVEELRQPGGLHRPYYTVVPPPDIRSESETRLAKPEGWGVELADAVIRILDICGGHGINLEKILADKIAYNKSREHRHGGKEY